jgi:DhnA family fructose-bisphosphate aldolase class Ia
VNSLRMNRLLGSKGRAVVVACDHGEFDGPQPGLLDPIDLLNQLGDAPDGILMSPGTLRRAASVLGKRNAPVPIVRLNWNSVYAFGWKPQDSVGATVIDAEEALRLGADVALVGLTLNTGSESVDAANIDSFCQALLGCRRLGLPAIGEYFPDAATAADPDRLHDEVVRGVRIVCELGADAVKTFLNPEWTDVIAGCPIPVFGLGAERKNSDLEALELAHGQIKAGASGVVFGRNVFQSDDPLRFARALSAVVKDGKEPIHALHLADAHSAPEQAN